MKHPGIIIQARNGSTRLPEKVSTPFFNSISILELICRRATANIQAPVVIATTKSSKDDNIADLSKDLQVGCYRGSEANVLSRFIEAAEHFQIDPVIRVCADNPFLSIELIRQLISEHTTEDYLCHQINGTPAMATHQGFFAELVSLQALKGTLAHATEDVYFEHVTNYIYQDENRFNVRFIELVPPVSDKIRLTVDNPNDWLNAQTVFKAWIEKGKDISNDILPDTIQQLVMQMPDVISSMSNNIKLYNKKTTLKL